MKSKITCPLCGCGQSTVVNCPRYLTEGIKRRRECHGCKQRYNTLEVVFIDPAPEQRRLEREAKRQALALERQKDRVS